MLILQSFKKKRHSHWKNYLHISVLGQMMTKVVLMCHTKKYVKHKS